MGPSANSIWTPSLSITSHRSLKMYQSEIACGWNTGNDRDWPGWPAQWYFYVLRHSFCGALYSCAPPVVTAAKSAPGRSHEMKSGQEVDFMVSKQGYELMCIHYIKNGPLNPGILFICLWGSTIKFIQMDSECSLVESKRHFIRSRTCQPRTLDSCWSSNQFLSKTNIPIYLIVASNQIEGEFSCLGPERSTTFFVWHPGKEEPPYGWESFLGALGNGRERSFPPVLEKWGHEWNQGSWAGRSP